MRLTLTLLGLVLLTATVAEAGRISVAGGRPMARGFSHGGLLFAENAQERFEAVFEEISTEYDSNLELLEDYYASDEYAELVSRMESLVDRYDFFVTNAELAVNRLDTMISLALDELDHYTDLLAEHQDRDDLSDERLERLAERVEAIQERLTERVELMSSSLDSLTGSLDSYTAFASELKLYLDEIVAAGGGAVDAGVTSALAAQAVAGDCGGTAATSAPGPISVALLPGVVAVVLLRCGRMPAGRRRLLSTFP